MRGFFFLLTWLALVVSAWTAPGHAQLAPTGGGAAPPHIRAALEAETAAPAPGQTVTLAFVMRPEPGWHGYWENPGDAGLGMTLKWQLPKGVRAGGLEYPVPETLIISGIMNHVYEENYAVLGSLTLSPDLRPGTRLPIAVMAEWLACTREICVPERGRLALDLTIGAGEVKPGARVAFDGYRARLPRPLGAEAHYARQGNRLRLAIPFPQGAAIGEPWFFARTDGAIEYAAPQSFSRNGDMLILEGTVGRKLGGRVEGLIRTGPHRGFLFAATPGPVPPAGAALIGDETARTQAVFGWGTVVLGLAGAVLGGLLLNIMPCVFPILSLKALSFAKAGGERRAVRRDALAYMAGAVLTCLLLGIVLLALRAGGEAVGWAFQLQRPEIILLLLVLIVAIALNLAGLFELGNVTAGGSLAEKGGVAGSFWTGALAAFVATPCTGPFMGAALGAALVLPVAASLAIFVGLGFGLALPFVLIAFVPALARILPKPGPWMATFRHVMAVPMFLTALALAWLLGRQGGLQAMTLGVAVALAAGLLLWWLGAHQRRGGRGSAGWLLGAAVLLLAAGGAAMSGAIRQEPARAADTETAIPFDRARLAGLQAEGSPVFLYFTADWCITCKANEAAAINRDEVRRAFEKAGVRVMIGDWTNADAEISRFLAEHGRSGVPLYLWYPGNGAPSRILPQILTQSLLIDLAGKTA